MQISLLFSLAAGLSASAVAAQDIFSDAVTFSLHYIKGDTTHFRTTIGDTQVTERTADKSALGIYLINRIDQKIAFEWSPDTAKVPVQSVRKWLQTSSCCLTR